MSRKIVMGLLAALLLEPAAAAAEPSKLRLRGRLQTRFEAEEKSGGDWTSAFGLKRARLDGRWKPEDWARLVLELEGAGALDLGSAEYQAVELRDAYGRIDIHPALRVQAGQFKKPFSRIKMTSPFDLLLPVRGMLNRYAVTRTSHGGFGGRDIGLMLTGRFKKLLRLRYHLGAFSGPEFIDGREESHRDLVGRVQVRPLKGLELAVNATHKLYHDSEGKTHSANLLGADLALELGGFTLLLEGAFGDNVDAGPGRLLWGFHGTAAYRLSLGAEWALTPALMVELFDPDDQIREGRALRLAGALNLDVGRICRVILFAEGASGELRSYDRSASAERQREVPTRVLLQLNLSF